MSDDSHRTPLSRTGLRQRKTSTMLPRKMSIVSEATSSRQLEMGEHPEGKADSVVGANLIEEEKMEIGGVKWTVYMYYGKAIGYFFSIGTLLLYAVYQGFSLGSNIWLSEWTADPLAAIDDDVQNKYLAVYGVMGVFQAVFIMAAVSCVMVGTLLASSKLHATMLQRILYSPMYFFDTTPLGRILNRFSKDMDIMDVTIPMNLRMLFNQLYNVLGTIFVICFANPIFITVVVPIGLMYYFLQKFYVTTARQVKRMESITRSPIYSHFGETINGAPTIRAYNLVDMFLNESEKRVDFNQNAYYPTFVSNRWLSIRLESIGNLIILFASLFAVLARDKMDPGKVGLSLSYALNITGAMNMLVRMTSEVETNMVSVERIREYQQTPQEAPHDIPEQDPPKEWPQYGVVRFENYQTRYREGLDLVLKGIDFEIMSGEKIGIVGRTGAGKSSLTLALFRIVEAAGGSIYIDNENIGLLGLRQLRSRLTIIPQDPVLFSGSMRMNLDPFNHYSDRNVWEALDHAHLKSFVSNLPGGLNFEVYEGGANLSVGQRQLVCLARALLRKTKVLILDEATAAVDLETDDLIQATIREKFADATVLTIAHRLNTIMDSSKVIVLDAGKVAEFDTPEKLLSNKRSIFFGMAKDAGLTNHLE
jgi:ATP-binding cassette subfamily C (CFTR/MRP) protein 1